MKRYTVELTEVARQNFKSLDGSQKKLVAVQLRKLETSPELGGPCGHKAGIDLTGCRKLYVAKKTLRIIYTIHEAAVTVEVITIGKRSELAAYRAARRSLDT